MTMPEFDSPRGLVTEQSSTPADEPTDPNRRPDYEDFRDDTGRIDWYAFRAAVAEYDPSDGEAAPSGG